MLIEFFKDGKGYFSHTRLISIIGSFCVFGVFIYIPENEGIQNLMTILLSGSLINATASKFADKRKQNTEEDDNIKPSTKKIRRAVD
jgi:hypothetical protein